jgi:hypothetical protein
LLSALCVQTCHLIRDFTHPHRSRDEASIEAYTARVDQLRQVMRASLEKERVATIAAHNAAVHDRVRVHKRRKRHVLHSKDLDARHLTSAYFQLLEANQRSISALQLPPPKELDAFALKYTNARAKEREAKMREYLRITGL